MQDFNAPPMVVHHKAALDGAPYPPNSLEAIRACLEAGAPFIEIDVVALAEQDYLLVHDETLENETTGTGAVAATHPDAIPALRIRHPFEATDYAPALLSQVVALYMEMGGASRLQIDYKNVLPMRSDEPIRRLIDLVRPLGARALVSSGADWNLRRMRHLAPWLDIGFDIGFYLDYRPFHEDPRLPPFRQGAYGYQDDHLLAAQRLIETSDYLEERCETLYRALPEASIWYVNFWTIAQCLQDGFNMAAWLGERGVRLDAWTLDADLPAAVEALIPLKQAGVAQFTSNTPHALAALLQG